MPPLVDSRCIVPNTSHEQCLFSNKPLQTSIHSPFPKEGPLEAMVQARMMGNGCSMPESHARATRGGRNKSARRGSHRRGKGIRRAKLRHPQLLHGVSSKLFSNSMLLVPDPVRFRIHGVPRMVAKCPGLGNTPCNDS